MMLLRQLIRKKKKRYRLHLHECCLRTVGSHFYSLECGHLAEMLKLFRFVVGMRIPPPTDISIQKGNVKARPLLLSLNRQQVFTLSHAKSFRVVPGLRLAPEVRFLTGVVSLLAVTRLEGEAVCVRMRYRCSSASRTTAARPNGRYVTV